MSMLSSKRPRTVRFARVAGEGLRRALEELDLPGDAGDVAVLTERIAAMPPFPEVVETLRRLKEAGYRLCIVSTPTMRSSRATSRSSAAISTA